MKLIIYLKRAVTVFFAILIASQFLNSEPVDLSDSQEAILKGLPADQQASIRQKIQESNRLQGEIENINEGNTLVSRPQKRVLSEEEQETLRIKSLNLIFGYDLFAKAPTTFAPATNIPVPIDYILGPGDLLSVNIARIGVENELLEVQVDRHASINLPGMLPIGVGGLKLGEARELIKKKISDDALGATASVFLKELRSIQVFVLGDAYMPGSYTVSALATITNALYVSGGVSETGSLRNIQLKRNGELVQTYDLYDLLLKGDTSKDSRLQPGDVIFIPVIKNRVRVQGAVRRPALYEVKDYESIGEVIELAAGLTSESLANLSELNRVNQKAGMREILKIDALSKDYLDMPMQDADILNIPKMSSMDEINIRLTGQFKYPGTYSVKSGEKLSDLLKRAGGFSKSAYLYGAVFTRRGVADMENAAFQKSADDLEMSIATAVVSGRNIEDLEAVSNFIQRLREVRSPGRLITDIDPINLEASPEKDFYLEDGDRIHIPIRRNSVTVVGDVLSPSTFPFKNTFKAKDYIKQSGGYKWGAEKSSVYIVLPDGQSRLSRTDIWRVSRNKTIIAPGTTIVVPKSTRPFDWLVLADSVAPILSNLVTTMAALAAIDD